jgi:hypothetical protein
VAVLGERSVIEGRTRGVRVRTLLFATVLAASGLLTGCQPEVSLPSGSSSVPDTRVPAEPPTSASPVPSTPVDPAPPGQPSASPLPKRVTYTLSTVSVMDGETKSVTLVCGPTVEGSHPKSALACGDLSAAGDDPARIAEVRNKPCTRELMPIRTSVVVEGRERYAKEFGNRCVMLTQTRALFDF